MPSKIPSIDSEHTSPPASSPNPENQFRSSGRRSDIKEGASYATESEYPGLGSSIFAESCQVPICHASLLIGSMLLVAVPEERLFRFRGGGGGGGGGTPYLSCAGVFLSAAHGAGTELTSPTL